MLTFKSEERITHKVLCFQNLKFGKKISRMASNISSFCTIVNLRLDENNQATLKCFTLGIIKYKELNLGHTYDRNYDVEVPFTNLSAVHCSTRRSWHFDSTYDWMQFAYLSLSAGPITRSKMTLHCSDKYSAVVESTRSGTILSQSCWPRAVCMECSFCGLQLNQCCVNKKE